MLHIKLKRITNAATWFPADPHKHTPTLGMGSVGQNSAVSEHGHVAYQITENQECSNMVADILHTDPPSTLGMGSVGHNSTFQNMVMLYIKL